MKNMCYCDGSPNREIENDDDWETTGQDEMNDLFQKHRNPTALNARDRLNNVNDLIDVCGAALLGSENRAQERIQRNVAHVLYFFVANELIEIEEELSQL